MLIGWGAVVEPCLRILSINLALWQWLAYEKYLTGWLTMADCLAG